MLVNRWVTVEKLAALTGLPIGTIRDWERRGKLRSATIDMDTRRVFVDIHHFNATLDERLREEVAMERS